MKNKNKFMLKILPLALIFVLFLCILNVVKVQCTELNDNIRCGDIDKNGDINISDGVILKKYLAHVAGITVDKFVGDVNADGEIDISDAVILIKFLSGMDINLGIDSEIPTIPEKENKKLVAYFSATGTTKKLAEQTAQILDADLYEITPQNPYSSEDLNYNNSDSRANIEQNDENARPVILGSIQNIKQYDLIILAYPIWWGQAPKIIYTFLESYDFSNKTILPFCTSGSSSIGNSAKNLEKCCNNTTKWLEGKRLSANMSTQELQQWIHSFGINDAKPEVQSTTNSTIKPEDATNKEEQTLKISFGQYQLEAIFEKNSSADAFKELLKKAPITINMSDYGNFEKVGSLETTLPRNDMQITAKPGDIILYQGNSITIYYDTNTWNFTRLAKIKDSENLKEKLGDGAVLVTFSLNK